MPLKHDVEHRCKIAMTEIFGNGVTVTTSISGDSVTVRVTGADIGEPGEPLNAEAKRDRERIALSKLSDKERALLDNPTLQTLARAEGKSPAEFWASVCEREDDLAVKAFHDAREPGAQRIQPKIYGRHLAD